MANDSNTNDTDTTRQHDLDKIRAYRASTQGTTIQQLADQLSAAITMGHAHDSITQDEMKALWELQANLIAALPRTWWLENYAKDGR